MNDPATPLEPFTNANGHASITIRSQVRTGQIISFALVQGVILTTAVLTYLAFGTGAGQAEGHAAGGAVSEGELGGEGGFLLPLIGLAVAVGCGVAAAVVPKILRGSAVERFRASGGSLPLPTPPEAELPPAAARLLGSWTAATLVAQALLEGPAIFNAVLMVIQPHYGYLVLIAVMLAGIAMQTPTVEKVQRFLETAARR